MRWDANTASEFSCKNELETILRMESNVTNSIWEQIERMVSVGEYEVKMELDFRNMFRPELAKQAVENYLDVLRSHGYDAEMKASEFSRGYVIKVEW